MWNRAVCLRYQQDLPSIRSLQKNNRDRRRLFRLPMAIAQPRGADGKCSHCRPSERSEICISVRQFRKAHFLSQRDWLI